MISKNLIDQHIQEYIESTKDTGCHGAEARRQMAVFAENRANHIMLKQFNAKVERRQAVVAADVEYVALLDLYGMEGLAEVNASDWEGETHGAWEDGEGSFAWSYAFERNDEHRYEMEWQDSMGFT